MHQGSLVFMLNNEFQLAKPPLILCEIIPVIKGFLSSKGKRFKTLFQYLWLHGVCIKYCMLHISIYSKYKWVFLFFCLVKLLVFINFDSLTLLITRKHQINLRSRLIYIHLAFSVDVINNFKCQSSVKATKVKWN